MKKIIQYFRLLRLSFQVSFRNIKEFIRVVRFYYPNRAFAKVDFYLLRAYLNQNPFKIAKAHLKTKGNEIVHAYGETPLTTLDQIAKECDLKAEDLVYEVGAGRGRTCFWLRFFVGCKVVGIECVPDFVHIAQHVRNRYRVKGVKFLCQDLNEVNYSEATVVYFYGTTAEESLVENLIKKLKDLKPGSKIITVSFPLTGFTEEPLFKVVKTFPAQFTWGIADVYLHVRS